MSAWATSDCWRAAKSVERVALRARIVEFLLGDEAGLRLRRLQQTVVVRLQGSMAGFGATDLMRRDVDLLLAALLLRLAAAILRTELGNFEHRERLAGVDAVADIDIDVAHIAGDLRVHIDHLVGLELPREREHVRYVAALDNADSRGDWLGGGIGRALTRFASGECKRQKERQGEGLSGEKTAETRGLLVHGRPVTRWCQ